MFDELEREVGNYISICCAGILCELPDGFTARDRILRLMDSFRSEVRKAIRRLEVIEMQDEQLKRKLRGLARLRDFYLSNYEITMQRILALQLQAAQQSRAEAKSCPTQEER